MEESRRYVRLGAFVTVSVALLVVVLFLLGGRKLFQRTFTFETYFNESVAGLELGAPVRFRGVPLGQVSEILTSSAVYERDVSLEKRKAYIVVRAKVTFSAEEAEQLEREMGPLVNRGLRAQTQLAGITGQQYLSLDFFDPAKYPALALQWMPKYPYLPSAPSLTGEIVAHAQSLLASLNQADIKALGPNLNALIIDLDKKLGEAPVAELSANAREVLRSANGTIQRVDRILSSAAIDHTLRKLDSVSARLDTLLADPGLKQTVDNVAAIGSRVRRLTDDGALDLVIKRADETLERLDAVLGDNQYDLRSIVQDLRVAAENLRVVSESVKRYPAGALVGGPPDKVQLPGIVR
jgi:phospholipid/cholesterol/gamma-HCH transport system substrate-binding protein